MYCIYYMNEKALCIVCNLLCGLTCSITDPATDAATHRAYVCVILQVIYFYHMNMHLPPRNYL